MEPISNQKIDFSEYLSSLNRLSIPQEEKNAFFAHVFKELGRSDQQINDFSFRNKTVEINSKLNPVGDEKVKEVFIKANDFYKGTRLDDKNVTDLLSSMNKIDKYRKEDLKNEIDQVKAMLLINEKIEHENKSESFNNVISLVENHLNELKQKLKFKEKDALNRQDERGFQKKALIATASLTGLTAGALIFSLVAFPIVPILFVLTGAFLIFGTLAGSSLYGLKESAKAENHTKVEDLEEAHKYLNVLNDESFQKHVLEKSKLENEIKEIKTFEDLKVFIDEQMFYFNPNEEVKKKPILTLNDIQSLNR